MNAYALRGLAAAMFAAGCLALLAVVWVPLGRDPVLTGLIGRDSTHNSPFYHADSLSRVIVGGNPFRIGRRPSDVSYDPERGAGAAPAGLPRPALRLVGMISGNPPAAIVDGLPDIEGGRVVRAGDTIGLLRVVSLSRNAVRIAGLDTVWTLTIGVR